MDKEQIRKTAATLWQMGEQCRAMAQIADDKGQYDEAEFLCDQGDAIDEIAAKLSRIC